MKIGFAKREITPPASMELGGYAGYRPNTGVHDPLWCKAVLLEQAGKRYLLAVLDLLAQDPRPAYQNDPARVYGFPFAGHEICFTVKDGTLTVVWVE